MKIEIKENLNIFYAYTILNLIGYDDDNDYPFHPLRIKVREDLKEIAKGEEFKKLRKLQSNDEMYPYWLVYISFHSDNNFKNYQPQVDYVAENQWYDAMLELIPTIKNIITKYKLEEYYVNNIQQEYQKIIEQLQKDIDKFPLHDELGEYWGVEIDGMGIIFPNPLDACHRAWAGNIGDTLLAVRGASYRDEKMSFEAEGVLHNALHEFSHTYADKIEDNITILWNKEYKKKGEKLHKVLVSIVDPDMQKQFIDNYINMDTLLDEIMVKASEIGFITPMVFKRFITEEKINEEMEYKLSNLKDQGFGFIGEVVDVISEGKEKTLSMEEIFVEVFNMLYEKYV